jgi:ATP-binding cassette subfamily F protein 3
MPIAAPCVSSPHDRTLIHDIANKIIEIRNGAPLVYNGNYDEFLAWKEATWAEKRRATRSKANSAVPAFTAGDREERKIAEGAAQPLFQRARR